MAGTETWRGRSSSPFRYLWFRTAGAIAAIVGPLLVLLPRGEIPRATAWDDASDPLVLFTVLVLGFAVVYGVFKAFDESKTDSATKELERRAGLATVLRTVYPIVNRSFPHVPVDEIGVHVWAVDPKSSALRRVEKCVMRANRDELSIEWTKGTGAIGQAWKQRQWIARDMTELVQAANDPEPAEFDALTEDARLGLSREDVIRCAHYKGVLAVPLTRRPRPEAHKEVVGILSIDFGQSVDELELKKMVVSRSFRDVRGSCEAWFGQE